MTLTPESLCQKLGYVFSNPQLLEDALCHRSFHTNNNERLEFLGDATLSFIITDALFRKYPQAKEGELSRLRANLVRGDTLAELALQFELGKYLHLGVGELKSGGLQRTSILADAMEAIIGAIYMDAGIEACAERILAWYASRLDNYKQLPELKDPKTLLQEYLQAYKQALPIYTILSITGVSHQQTFHVQCTIPGLPYTGEGSGRSRRRAEQEAAQKILDLLPNE